MLDFKTGAAFLLLLVGAGFQAAGLGVEFVIVLAVIVLLLVVRRLR